VNLSPFDAVYKGMKRKFLIIVTVLATAFVGRAAADETVAADWAVNLPTVVVEASRLSVDVAGTNYQPIAQKATSRIVMKASETPASVATITPVVMDDLHIYTMKDATAYLPGVHNVPDAGFLLDYDQFNIRGFRQTYAWRDGMKMYGGNVIDMDTVERADVVKGPFSGNYGMMEQGGLVNYVTKMAKFEPLNGYVQGSIESYWRTRETFDYGGTLVDDKLAGRLFGTFQAGKNYRQYDDTVFTIGDSWLFTPTDQDELELKMVYTHERRRLDQGVPIDANGNLLGKSTEFFGDPNADGAAINDFMTTLGYHHTFDDDAWVYDAKANFHYFRNDLDDWRMGKFDTTRHTYTGNFDRSACESVDVNFDQDISCFYSGNGCENTAALGTEGRFRVYTWDKEWYTGGSYDYFTAARTPFTGLSEGRDRQYMYSLAEYLQDHAVLFDDIVHLYLCGRADQYWLNDNLGTQGDKHLYSFDNALTGNAGILFKPIAHFNPYASVGNSFKVQNIAAELGDGSRPNPETGVQYEAGVKSPWFDDRLLLGFALFEIDRQNVIYKENLTDQYYKQAGKLRSDGIELSAQGKLTDRLDVIAQYTWLNTRFIDNPSDATLEGNEFSLVPENSGAVWLTRHHLESDFLPGLRYGTGFEALDRRYADDKNTLAFEPYFVWNAMVGYTFAFAEKYKLHIQLNLHNLLNSDYVRAGSTSTVIPGAPFGGTLTVRFIF